MDLDVNVKPENNGKCILYINTKDGRKWFDADYYLVIAALVASHRVRNNIMSTAPRHWTNKRDFEEKRRPLA